MTRLNIAVILYPLPISHLFVLESIQDIRKRPTYRFEDTIVWKKWHFWRSEINIDYHLIQCIRGFCSSPLPIFKLSVQVPWIDSNLIQFLIPVYQKEIEFVSFLSMWSNASTWGRCLDCNFYFNFLLILLLHVGWGHH